MPLPASTAFPRLERSAPARPSVRRRARLVLAVAVGALLAQSWWFTGVWPTWHEEVSVHASVPAVDVVVENGVARTASVCDAGSWLRLEEERPYVVLCAGGLAWPILVTPYIGGVHYWPLQLLRPLHRGDPVALRRTALPVGALGLIVLFLLVEQVGGSRRAAAAVAVAAVVPAVVSL